MNDITYCILHVTYYLPYILHITQYLPTYLPMFDDNINIVHTKESEYIGR